MEELTERFYVVREQRNRLLWACEKALAAYDAAYQSGLEPTTVSQELRNARKSTWKGKDVDKMRAAVAACLATRAKEASEQSLSDLAASGGIVAAP